MTKHQFSAVMMGFCWLAALVLAADPDVPWVVDFLVQISFMGAFFWMAFRALDEFDRAKSTGDERA